MVPLQCKLYATSCYDVLFRKQWQGENCTSSEDLLFPRYFQFSGSWLRTQNPQIKRATFLSQRDCFKNASQLEHFKCALTGKKGKQLLRIKANKTHPVIWQHRFSYLLFIQGTFHSSLRYLTKLIKWVNGSKSRNKQEQNLVATEPQLDQI